MHLIKYIELHWKKITLNTNLATKNLALHVASSFPTLQFTNNRKTKWINYMHYVEQNDNLSIFPAVNNIVFCEYVSDYVEVHFSLWSFEEPVIQQQMFHKIPIKQIESFIFDGIEPSATNAKKLCGMAQIKLDCHTTISLFDPLIASIFIDNVKIGEIELELYIKPVNLRKYIFNRDVLLFPINKNEIAIYYNGDLADARQVYMIWTLDGWDSNFLKKMKRIGNIWSAIIKKTTISKQLECAFTNNAEAWDNQNGNNWLFSKTHWC